MVEFISNRRNRDFYENIPRDQFRRITSEVGLDRGEDIDQILPYLKKAKNLLDIGAGTGRAIRFLRRGGFKGKITALERSESFLGLLKDRSDNKVTTLEADLLDTKLPKNFDAAIWLFGGIQDFSATEQRLMIHKLARSLTEKGILIIDTRQGNPLAQSASQQVERLKVENLNWSGYVPTLDEIQTFGSLAGFSNLTWKPYETYKGNKRILYIFER